MKLSVAIITYNHESFITQALESALNQRTSFDFEIVVGEDCSTDGTRERIDATMAQYPGRIRLVTSPKNVGMNPNLARTINACSGEYVALLEGDDFWTDPAKLQKQVDRLEANPDCAICFHDIHVLNQTTGEEIEATRDEDAERYSLADLLTTRCVMHTCSVVFRRQEGLRFPDWYFKAPVGDLPLHCLNLGKGASQITLIPEVMAKYRVHPGGVWSQGGLRNSQDGPARAFTIRRHVGGIEVREMLNAHLRYKYDRAIRRFISRSAWNLVWLFQLEEDWSRMRKYFWKALRARPLGGAKISFIAKSFLAAHLPKLYRAQKRNSP